MLGFVLPATTGVLSSLTAFFRWIRGRWNRASFVVSPDNERIGVHDIRKDELVSFLWEGGRPVEEFLRFGKDGGKAKGRRYVWAVGQLLEQEDERFDATVTEEPGGFLLGGGGVTAGERRHAWVDHLGSVRGLTDPVGAVMERTTWGPWGEGIAGGRGSRMGYTGHQREVRSGLHHAMWRSLDPWGGRWTQRDPAGSIGGFNRFTYALSNPLGSIDPTGLIAVGFSGFLEDPGFADGTDTLATGIGMLPRAGTNRLFNWRSLNAAEAFLRSNVRPDEPIILYGYSLGASQALQLAKRLQANPLPGNCMILLGGVDPINPRMIAGVGAATLGLSVAGAFLGRGGALARVALAALIAALGTKVVLSPSIHSDTVPGNVSKSYGVFQRNGLIQGGEWTGAKHFSRDATNFDPAIGAAGLPWQGHGAIESSARVRQELLEQLGSGLQ